MVKSYLELKEREPQSTSSWRNMGHKIIERMAGQLKIIMIKSHNLFRAMKGKKLWRTIYKTLKRKRVEMIEHVQKGMVKGQK